MHTDASGFAVGAVLQQDQGKGLQPIAFLSKKMIDAETRYPVHEQELLAIIQALTAWRHYLHGSKFVVRTDHKSLQLLPDSADAVRAPGALEGCASRTSTSISSTWKASPTWWLTDSRADPITTFSWRVFSKVAAPELRVERPSKAEPRCALRPTDLLLGSVARAHTSPASSGEGPECFGFPVEGDQEGSSR